VSGPLLLAIAIGCEVAATLALKASAAHARPWLAALSVAGYAVAFSCLALSLRSLPVGLAYAVWAGVGTLGVALLGAWLFRESPPALAWLGVALVVGGVGLLGASLPSR
jgi:small multidrug resistance pump